MAAQNVISTVGADGAEVMGPGVLMYRYPGSEVVDGSLLAVESNHFCVLKSRGAVLNVYETGQYTVETPQRPLVGSVQQASSGGRPAWHYEALFVSRAKGAAKAKGVAISRELAELVYDVDYYLHVDTPQDAVKLVSCAPYSGHLLTAEALGAHAGPVIERAINQVVQVTPFEQVNERIHEITELVLGHAHDFLAGYGVTPSEVKVLLRPRDERLRELVSLRALGLSALDAVRYYAALKMTEQGLVSAPNMAAGQPFHAPAPPPAPAPPGIAGLPPAPLPPPAPASARRPSPRA